MGGDTHATWHRHLARGIARWTPKTKDRAPESRLQRCLLPVADESFQFRAVSAISVMNLPEPDSKVTGRAQARVGPEVTVSTPVAGATREAIRGGSIRERTTLAGRWSAAKVTAIYALFGVVWICFSDWLLAAVVSDSRRLTLIQDNLDWIFILGSACLLYLLLRLDARARERLEVALR